MCEYCNFDNASSSGEYFIDSSGNDGDMLIEKSSGYYWLHASNYSEYPDVMTQIHYCPICGRKLD